MPARRTVKVAVVGSGLAGLTAAYRLARTPFLDDVEFEVHVFEKASSLGMDSHSISLNIPGPNGQNVERRIDVPMRSFQGGYYPQLIALYKHLGVKFRERDFSYSFSTLNNLSARTEDHQITTTMIYNGASGREGVSIPSIMLSETHYKTSLWSEPFAFALVAIAHINTYGLFVLSTLLLVYFYVRLVVLSLPINVPERILLPFKPYSIPLWVPFPARPTNTFMTLLEWTEKTTPRSIVARWLGLDSRWQEFVSNVLIPLFSAVCTADEDRIWDHPVEELLDYIWLTLGTHHYVVLNGVRDVVQRITRPIQPSNIHLSTPIVSLVHNFDDISRQASVDIHCANNVVFSGFSHVVLATQANHASTLLHTYLDTLPPSTTPKMQEILDYHRTLVTAQVQTLARFTYCPTIVVNHTDPTVLPSSPSDRRDLNLVMAPQLDPADDKTASLSELDLDLASEADDGRLCLPPTYTMATHVLPGLAGVYQTTNPIVPPAEGSVLSAARLQRAVVTADGKDALGALWRGRERARGWGWGWGCAGGDGGVLGPLQGAGRLQLSDVDFGRAQAQIQMPGVWVCGSYAHCGIPLLEGCVVSGRNVVEQGIWTSEGVDASKAGRLW